MTENFKAKQTLINIPVKDVKASKQFFIDIGFLLNEAMTDANATCFEIGTNIYMLRSYQKLISKMQQRKD